jgi:hypothetical protein
VGLPIALRYMQNLPACRKILDGRAARCQDLLARELYDAPMIKFYYSTAPNR